MILLSVGPGRGALYGPEMVRELAAAGHGVEVVFGTGAGYFVGPAAFAPFAPVVGETTKTPEALVFAPATAGTLARLARGLTEGSAERAYSAAGGAQAGALPTVVVPELDGDTREHPAVRENIELLIGDGVRVLEGSAVASPLAVANGVLNAVANATGGPLSGVRVLVTAGGTREPIDRVRVISNRSSGKMGRAVAREAYRRGAEVTVVAANVEEEEPGVEWVGVETYEEMEEETTARAGKADALIMAAAVSDFTPETVDEGKIRRGGREELDLKLVATGDILAAVREKNPDLFMVGFAATFGDPREDAREKLGKKGINLVVGNDISRAGSGFGSDENEVYIVGEEGERHVARAPKTEVAGAILDALFEEMNEDGRSA